MRLPRELNSIGCRHRRRLRGERACCGGCAVRLLLDEMYSPALADALRDAGLDAFGVRDWLMGGAGDADVLAAAAARGYVVVTENVADFTRLAADYTTRGQTHPGVIIALSSRFSRRRSGIPAIVVALDSLDAELGPGEEAAAGRVVFLR